MRTDDFVALLANRVALVRPHATSRRLATALLLGLSCSMLLVAAVPPIESAPAPRMAWPDSWVRFALVCMLGAAGYRVVHRLARPGARVGLAWWSLVLPGAALGFAALGGWMHAASDGIRLWPAFVDDWQLCALGLLLASLPVLAAELLALRGLAPTRPAMSGAVAGILAGALGIAAHGLGCPELVPAVVAAWDVVCILVSMGLGMLLGAWLLRW